jgi:hypothetical protein
MSIIFNAIGLEEILVVGINLSPLAPAKVLITFQLAQ